MTFLSCLVAKVFAENPGKTPCGQYNFSWPTKALGLNRRVKKKKKEEEEEEEEDRDWQGKGNRESSFPFLTQSRFQLKSSLPNLGKSSLLYLSSAFTVLLKLDIIWLYQFENQCIDLASRMVARHFYYDYILNMVLALLQSLLAFSKLAYLLRTPSRKCYVLSKPFGWCLSQTLLPSATKSFHWLMFPFIYFLL